MEKTTTHYVFSHIVVPWLYFNGPDYFLGNFVKGKEDFLDYLKFVWNKIKDDDKFKDDLSDREDRSEPPIDVFLHNLDNGWMLGLITMPKPTMISEALSIAFAFKDELNTRYFTFELGSDEEQKKYNFFICEWDKEGKHSNYGTIENPDMSMFIEKVEKILSEDNKIN